MNAISLRAFSKMTFGSCDVQRRQFGAKTMAKLDESILVLATTSGCENFCRKHTKYVSTCGLDEIRELGSARVNDLIIYMFEHTILFNGGILFMMSATSLGSSVATHSS